MIINEKEYLQQLHNSLGEAVFAVKLPERIIEYVNPAIKDVFGYTYDECIGKSTEMMYETSQDYFKYGKLVNENIKQNNKIVNIEFKFKRKNGEVFFAEITTSFIKKNGKLLSAVSIVKDITERKQKERSLIESQTLFTAITNTAIDSIFCKDINRRYTFINNAMANLLGCNKADILGKNPEEVFGPEAAETIREIDDLTFSGKKVDEIRPLYINGEKHFFHTVQVPIYIDNGKVLSISGIVRDVTKNMQMMKELEEYRNNLEELIDTRTKELKQKTVNLEEVNIALKVLLEQRKKDKKAIEKNVYNNIKKLVNPYLEKLKGKVSDPTGNSYLDIMESNLKEITSLFSPNSSEEITKLTPAELQIANLIKYGKTSKEIAEFLNLSRRTVNFHRENIRNKLGLKNQKANLRSHLMAIN